MKTTFIKSLLEVCLFISCCLVSINKDRTFCPELVFRIFVLGMLVACGMQEVRLHYMVVPYHLKLYDSDLGFTVEKSAY